MCEIYSRKFLAKIGSNQMKPSDVAPDPFKPPTDLIVVTTPFVSGYHVTKVPHLG